MTVLPFLDVKATPICSVASPRVSRSTSLPRSSEHKSQSLKISSSSHLSDFFASTTTPKIKIYSRTDQLLKKLPHAKTARAQAGDPGWRPFVRDLPDYDYLWDTVTREHMRHQYDDYVPPPRINPNEPEKPYQMSSIFETQDRHYHNYKRLQAMQQRKWNRDRMQYSIYPYGEAEERETYRKNLRSTLKEQMEQKAQAEKNELDIKHSTTQEILDQDRKFLEEEKHRNDARARLLAQTTVKNKELMENKWEYNQWNRTHQWHVERAMLADSPINWSKTMT
ncbi:unnamed protein product [Adineta steineri]|nr:unnamed protein product [Adineta steineri]CAF0785287.1 unnamed protein product [Adineta steineri]CAF3693045.1 unnamed protein product [Adineta steineri]